MIRSPRIFGRPLWTYAVDLYGALPWTRKPVRWLCRALTGHRAAEGERGYMLGQVELYCAYCYVSWLVPADEMPTAADDLVGLYHLADGSVP